MSLQALTAPALSTLCNNRYHKIANSELILHWTSILSANKKIRFILHSKVYEVCDSIQ